MSQLISVFTCLVVAILSVQVRAQACPAPSPCTCSGTTITCNSRRLTAVPQFEFSDSHNTLYLDNNDIGEVPDNAFRNLPTLNYLRMNNNKLTTVHPKAFNGVLRLTRLDLNDNQQMQTLPDNVFDTLTKMTTLLLQNNKLTTFPVKSLAKAIGGRKMGALYLSNNPNLPCNVKDEIVSHIQTPGTFSFPSPCAAERCPTPLPCTCEGKEIRCNKLGLIEVPLFEFSDSHTWLYLYDNDIEEVPDNAFRNLPNLEYLSIDNNKLMAIHPKAFNGLSRLGDLDLYNNELQTLPDNVFDTLTNLATLSLHSNKLTTVHPNAFNGLSRLEYFVLYNNQLQTLPDNVFDTLTELSWLSLNNNDLAKFPVKSLANAVGGRKMGNLNLSNNPNLPCNLKHEIRAYIQTPATFEFPSPCGVTPAV